MTALVSGWSGLLCVRTLRWCVCVSIDGLTPPIEEWQKAINDQLEKIRKLEEIYDNELTLRKVYRASR